MINLCDVIKYYKDSTLDTEADRTPSPNEDIEIIGIIPTDEYINMTALSGCGLSTIGSLTMTFASSTGNLNIYKTDAASSGFDLSNPRAPTGLALSGIMKSNPLRANHGWYTINPTGYRIGSLTTNSIVNISEMGLNNDIIICSLFRCLGGIYANGLINTSGVVLANNKFYGTTLECQNISGFGSKMDTLSLTTTNLNLLSTSIADSTIRATIINATGSNFIDCNLDYGVANLDNCIIQGTAQQNSNIELPSGLSESPIYKHKTYLNNCKIGSGTISFASIDTDRAYLTNTTIDGFLKTKIIDGEGNIIGRNGTLDAEYLAGTSEWISSGTLIISYTIGPGTPILTNINGSTTWNNFVQCQLSQPSGSTNILNSGVSVGGFNGPSGTIKGKIFIANGFTNGGSIITTECIFYEGTNSASGFIDKVIGYNFINNGNINNGIFISESASNNGSGYVDNGIFISGSTNGSSGNILSFYTGSINNGSGNIINLYENAISNKTINVGTLYDISVNNGEFNTLDLYGSSINNGSGHILNVYESGQNNGINISFANFYDKSQCNSISFTSGLGVYNFYDNAILNNGGSNFECLFSFYDDSSVTGSLMCTTGNFYNRSSIQTSANMMIDSGLYMRNKSYNKGIIGSESGNIYFFDQSMNNGGIAGSRGLVYFNDRSYSGPSGNIRMCSGFFYDTSYNEGTISHNTYVLFDGPGVYNKGDLKGTGIFENNSINYASLDGSRYIKFNNNSINRAIKLSNNTETIIFDNNSINENCIIKECENVIFSNNSISSKDTNTILIWSSGYGEPPDDLVDLIGNYVNNNTLNGKLYDNMVLLDNSNNIKFINSINNAVIRSPNVIFSGYAINNAYFGWDTTKYNQDIEYTIGQSIFGNDTIVLPKIGEFFGINSTNIIFTDNSINSKKIYSTTIDFNNNSINYGNISCTSLSFKNSSTNNSRLGSASALMSIVFDSGCTNNGIISNPSNLSFQNNSSNNNDIIVDTASTTSILFTNSINNGNIIATGGGLSLNITFNSGCSNMGAIYAGSGVTISFDSYSENNGLIISEGNISFNNYSWNKVEISGDSISYNNNSINESLSRSSSNGSIGFNNGSVNVGTSTPAVSFSNGSINSGLVGLSGYPISFSNGSINMGIVCGDYTYDQTSQDNGTSNTEC